jgi:hypothetical protein
VGCLRTRAAHERLAGVEEHQTITVDQGPHA